MASITKGSISCINLVDYFLLWRHCQTHVYRRVSGRSRTWWRYMSWWEVRCLDPTHNPADRNNLSCHRICGWRCGRLDSRKPLPAELPVGNRKSLESGNANLRGNLYMSKTLIMIRFFSSDHRSVFYPREKCDVMYFMNIHEYRLTASYVHMLAAPFPATGQSMCSPGSAWTTPRPDLLSHIPPRIGRTRYWESRTAHPAELRYWRRPDFHSLRLFGKQTTSPACHTRTEFRRTYRTRQEKK